MSNKKYYNEVAKQKISKFISAYPVKLSNSMPQGTEESGKPIIIKTNKNKKHVNSRY